MRSSAISHAIVLVMFAAAMRFVVRSRRMIVGMAAAWMASTRMTSTRMTSSRIAPRMAASITAWVTSSITTRMTARVAPRMNTTRISARRTNPTSRPGHGSLGRPAL